jgi:hypothetical protein
MVGTLRFAHPTGPDRFVALLLAMTVDATACIPPRTLGAKRVLLYNLAGLCQQKPAHASCVLSGIGKAQCK